MRFEFATASRIFFGAGTFASIGPLARDVGRRALVVTGRDPRQLNALLAHLAPAGVAVTPFPVAGEPTLDIVVQGAARARAVDCDFVIGLGGGAALDAAKAIAALRTNDGDVFDYLEVVGRAQPLTRPAAPCIAIPTTAGTGSEVTRNAVVTVTSHRVKVSLRSAHMLPRIALVDPELTHSMPATITAATGLDAVTQVIEPYLSNRANPLTDSLCVDGIRRAARSLRRAVENGQDSAARTDMSLASLYGGLALANAGLGAVHGFAGPIGGMFPAPHGAVCAALLPHVLAANLRALRVRAPHHDALRRFDEVGRIVTQRAQGTADDGVQWASELVRDLRIPTLRSYGVTERDVDAIVEAAAKSSSMKANPLPLTTPELRDALCAAL